MIPEGFYKHQYAKFAQSYGAKLNLSDLEVKNYWEENKSEYCWRFEYEGSVLYIEDIDTYILKLSRSVTLKHLKPYTAFGELADFSNLKPERLQKLEEIVNAKNIPSERTDEKFFEDHLRYWNERPQRMEKLEYWKN